MEANTEMAVTCEVAFTTSISPASVAAAVALALTGMEKRTKLVASTAATAEIGREAAVGEQRPLAQVAAHPLDGVVEPPRGHGGLPYAHDHRELLVRPSPT